MSTTHEFAARLNLLFDTVHPPGRGPHTSAEVISALRGERTQMSAPYLSQLRTGQRTNPSQAAMTALAEFFRVDKRYFTDDSFYRKVSEELRLLASLRDDGVRKIAVRTIGLSPTAQMELICKAEELRRVENLDDAD
jgi:transcriptional regulator with XRE-family HTH domain